MWLFALFIAVPLIEIALFIQVGGAIGLWPTLLIVVLTAVIGTQLMRAQGAMAMQDLQKSFGQLQDPTEPLAHGAMILFSGALLLTPGFFTDAVGFALLIPAFRRAAFKWAKSRVKVQSFTMGQGTDGQTTYREYRSDEEDVIDGDFTDVSPDQRPTHQVEKGPSGWTKH
ncbi:FxsA family protein [Aliiroseovarius sp. KMU-50]|uniref:FxsA family protein n=1 Tax=Aliiroseovarius salicola TaxID=3009082 RepID=A0ABT4VXK1_9RHOB|nr:FxsA family protein [Aliiroseovarius sp. KMU-50]MDA5092993.1 FxsA family protein [Aliiroseovarius sp. KMU-50]